MFTTWQAMQISKVLVPGKQGPERYLRNCARCPDGCSVLGEQCSDPDRNHFRQIWLVGIIPNPYDRTSAATRLLTLSNSFLN